MSTTCTEVTRTSRKPRKMADSTKALAAIRVFDLNLEFFEGNMRKEVTIVDPDTTVVSLMAALRNGEHGDLLSAAQPRGEIYDSIPGANGRDRQVLIATWGTDMEDGLEATDFTASCSYYADDGEGDLVEVDL